MSIDLFCAAEGMPVAEPRLYEACGLDNIWLVNGYSLVTRAGEEHVLPEDLEALHRAIALHLAMYRKPLSGREIRFIRRAIDMTQAELGHELGVHGQTIARWEKDQIVIPAPEDQLLRINAILAASAPDQFAALIREMPKSLGLGDEGPARRVSFTHSTRVWRQAA